VNGEVNPVLFHATLITMGVTTFSFVFSAFFYYGSSLGGRVDDPERVTYARNGDRMWLLGYSLLFLVPSLILFTVRLVAVGAVWLVLWLVYVVFVARYFPRVVTRQK
jgi:hypothetical protein